MPAESLLTLCFYFTDESVRNACGVTLDFTGA